MSFLLAIAPKALLFLLAWVGLATIISLGICSVATLHAPEGRPPRRGE